MKSRTLLVGLFLLPQLCQAADKSAYNLFHPVPRSELREFDTDRPDRTEAPYTVDAGHFQIETELFGYVNDKDAASGAEEIRRQVNVGTINLKAGIFSNLEAQAIFPAYGRETTTAEANREVAQGPGDLQLRLKYNFLGNDEGQVAMGILPWVKIPTAKESVGNGKWEGGVILPLFVHLPHEWDLETMVELAREKDEIGEGFHNVFESSLSFEHKIVGKLGGFAEVFGEASSERNAGIKATFDTGLVYAIGEDMQLDAGINIGITEAAEDLNPFVGISYRL